MAITHSGLSPANCSCVQVSSDSGPLRQSQPEAKRPNPTPGAYQGMLKQHLQQAASRPAPADAAQSSSEARQAHSDSEATASGGLTTMPLLQDICPRTSPRNAVNRSSPVPADLCHILLQRALTSLPCGSKITLTDERSGFQYNLLCCLPTRRRSLH